MRYRTLGTTGLRVSEICLGTMTFGEDWGWGADEQASRSILDRFADAGGNFIDTANSYTNGTSESFLGTFLEGRRDRFVIGTKYTHAGIWNDPNGSGNHRKNMVRSLHESLRRLQTDYVDVFWLHAWDFLTPVEEVVRALDDMVSAGKVLHVGLSDTPAWIVARAATLAELRDRAPIAAVQVEHSLAQRTAERELLPMARTMGLGILAWAPLGAGLLSGKYTRESPVGAGARRGRLEEADLYRGALNERTRSIARAVDDIARSRGVSSAQVALAWLLAQPARLIPIIGARTVAQLDDNLGAFAFSLDDGERERLDRLTRPELGFPHDFLASEAVRQMVFGGLHARLRR